MEVTPRAYQDQENYGPVRPSPTHFTRDLVLE